MTESLAYKLSLFFSLVGLGVAGYLLYVYTFGLPLPCSSSGCEVVRFSKYSKIFGVTVPLYGVMFYLGILGISGLALVKKPYAKPLLLLGTTTGFLFSLYFTGLELFVIKAICNWCVVSAIISTILYGIALSLLDWKQGLFSNYKNAVSSILATRKF